jgi:hypothetical protein
MTKITQIKQYIIYQKLTDNSLRVYDLKIA